MTGPAVAVVFPAAPDRPRLLARAVFALRHQTLAADRFEVVVAVDGGDDGQIAEAVCPDAHPFQVRIVDSPRPRGAIPHRNHARQTGCEAATAPLLWTWDSDFLLHPDALSHLLHETERFAADGRTAVFSCCLKTMAVAPGEWLERSARWMALEAASDPEAGAAFREALLGDLAVTISRIYSGFGKEFAPGAPGSRPFLRGREDDLREGFPSVPRAVLDAVGGWPLDFVGWGGNKEALVDQLKGLRDAGLLDVRLLTSVVAVHQSHRADRESRAMTPRRAQNHARRNRRVKEIAKNAGWWRERVECARGVLPAPRRGKGRRRPLVEPNGVAIAIFTYGRARLCLDLLGQIEEQRPKGSGVLVFDDASPEGYDGVREWCAARPWARYERAQENHGKHGFGRWVSHAYQRFERTGAGTFYLLQDDVALCDRFFARTLRAWRQIPKSSSTAAMTLLVDEQRETRGAWTSMRPREVGSLVEEIGWVDGLTMCGRRYFEILGWKVPPVPADRWATDPNLSSGVGKVLTEAISAAGGRLYRIRQSAVVHRATISMMNPIQRTRHALRTIRFVDGPERARELELLEPITACMATYPARADACAEVLERLSPQVSQIWIYANGYDEVPEWMRRPGVSVTLAREAHGDLGDAGKFAMAAQVAEGYVLTVDDDLAYPPDYAARLIERAEAYARRAVVGVHGYRWTTHPAEISARHVLHYRDRQRTAGRVHVLGTGTVAYHRDTIPVERGWFERPNMADIWFARAAQRLGVPLVSVPRGRRWLTDIEGAGGRSIWRRSKKGDLRAAIDAAISDLTWTLPDLVQAPGRAPSRKTGAGDFADLAPRLAKIIGRSRPIAVLGPVGADLVSRIPGARMVEEGALAGSEWGGVVVVDELWRRPDRSAMGLLSTASAAVRFGGRLILVERTLAGNRREPGPALRAPIEYQRAEPGLIYSGQYLAGGTRYAILAARIRRR